MAKRVWNGVGLIPCGIVNAYLLDGGRDGFLLVDAGFSADAARLVEGIHKLGVRLEDVKHIVLTHAHPDHIGGLAAIAEATGAQTWMHEADASIAERGSGFRDLEPSSEWLPHLIYRLAYRKGGSVEPSRIDHRLKGGDVIPFGGGLLVIHAPGHCAGQIALMWDAQRAIFVGDVCTNILGLTEPAGYEDQVVGLQSQVSLCQYDYDFACFGHGRPLRGDAAAKMRHRWLRSVEP